MTETIVPPVPELPAECCAKCKFFIGPDAQITAPGMTFCRREPPTAFIIGLTWNETHTQVIGNQQLSTFPNVVPGNWCGEYIPKKEFAN